MNGSIGKFAQTKTHQELFIDSVEETQEYIMRGIKALRGIGDTNYLFKEERKGRPKNYYCPIISTLVNAWARVYMWRELKKYDPKQLLYTDTDSIIHTGPRITTNIGNGIGAFKREAENVNCIIYGKKTYAIGNDIKIAGIAKRNVTMDDFREGHVTDHQMVTLKTKLDTQTPGTFTQKEHDSVAVQENHEQREEVLRNENIYIS